MSTIDTGTQDLLASKENGVGILTMNRPEARNAMSGEMNAAMQEMLAQFETDTEIRCVVLTGAGKGFCAGGDVKGMAAAGDGTFGKEGTDQDLPLHHADGLTASDQVVSIIDRSVQRDSGPPGDILG